MLRIPLMGFGTWKIDSHDVLINALRIGYRHFDLAESYANLSLMKSALTTALSPVKDGGLGIRREEIWLTIKVNIKVDLLCSICRLLDEVGTSYFDLVLYHRPNGMFQSRDILASYWKQITELPTELERKVRVSNFYLNHMNRLLDVCDEFDYKYPFANEIQLSPYVYHDEDYLIHICSDNGISIIAYSSLGYDGAEKILGDASLTLFAQKIQITTAQQISTAQLILSWLISKNICVIPKSNSFQRQEENFASAYISVGSIASYLHQIDNLSEDVEKKYVFLGISAFEAKKDAALLTWP